MVSKVQPGAKALERMTLYRRVAEIGLLRDSYAGKFALAAFVGILIPLATFILYLLFTPFSVIWALLYYGLTLGGPACATIGMRMVGIEMRTWYGGAMYFLLGAVHAIAFWLTVSLLTPFVLLVGLFNDRKRLLHDMLLGTVVVNSAARPGALRPR